MSEYMIPIPSRVYNAAVDGHVAGADQIIDDKTGLTLDKVVGGALEEKEHISSSNNGMGRVVLRKNLVEGVNTLTQSMINKSNTIYVIQYDFTLGEDITVPENCVLDFDGGSISGTDTITFNNTLLEGEVNILCGISGNVSNNYVDITWFGAKSDDTTFDNAIVINKLMEWQRGNKPRRIYIPAGTFYVKQSIVVPNSTTRGTLELFGNNMKTSCIIAGDAMDYMFITDRYNVQSIFRNFQIFGNRTGTYYENNTFNPNSTTLAKCGFYFPNGFNYGTFENIIISDFNGYGIYAGDSYQINYRKVYIYRCHFGMLLTAANGENIQNCEFNTIKNIGVIVEASRNVSITNNIFEIIGVAAVSSYGSDVNFTQNYLESCSKNGYTRFSFYNYASQSTPIIIDKAIKTYFIHHAPMSMAITDFDFDNTKFVMLNATYSSVTNFKDNNITGILNSNICGLLALNGVVYYENNKISNEQSSPFGGHVGIIIDGLGSAPKVYMNQGDYDLFDSVYYVAGNPHPMKNYLTSRDGACIYNKCVAGCNLVGKIKNDVYYTSAVTQLNEYTKDGQPLYSGDITFKLIFDEYALSFIKNKKSIGLFEIEWVTVTNGVETKHRELRKLDIEPTENGGVTSYAQHWLPGFAEGDKYTIPTIQECGTSIISKRYEPLRVEAGTGIVTKITLVEDYYFIDSTNPMKKITQ